MYTLFDAPFGGRSNVHLSGSFCFPIPCVGKDAENEYLLVLSERGGIFIFRRGGKHYEYYHIFKNERN